MTKNPPDIPYPTSFSMAMRRGDCREKLYCVRKNIPPKPLGRIRMGLFGKIFSFPVRVLNVPARTIENLLDVEEKDRVASRPLEALAEAIEEAAEDIDDD